MGTFVAGDELHIRCVSMNPLYHVPDRVAQLPPVVTNITGSASCGLGDLEYPFHDRTVTVTQCGHPCIGTRKINLGAAFAGRNVGVKEVNDKI
jgi:hypothetical protein